MYNPNFVITNSILSLISGIEASRQIIENAPLVPEFERKFQEDAMTRTVHYSTMIEDDKYRLELEEARRIIEGEKVSTFRKRDVREIINYRSAIQYINSQSHFDMSIELIIEIHKLLMDGILAQKYLGELRRTKVVGISSKTHEVVFETPHHDEIYTLLEEFFEWYNSKSKEIHPIIKAAITHYELVRIHPFVDGNGRMSRLVATLSLYRDGYDIQKFFSLEEYYDQNIEEYYRALDSVQELGELTAWIHFFSKGLAEELSRVKERVLKMSRDFRNKQKLGQISLNERQIEIIDFIQQKGKIQNKDWRDLFYNVSDDTILRDLKGLIDKKIVRKQGKTKSAYYVIF